MITEYPQNLRSSNEEEMFNALLYVVARDFQDSIIKGKQDLWLDTIDENYINNLEGTYLVRHIIAQDKYKYNARYCSWDELSIDGQAQLLDMMDTYVKYIYDITDEYYEIFHNSKHSNDTKGFIICDGMAAINQVDLEEKWFEERTRNAAAEISIDIDSEVVNDNHKFINNDEVAHKIIDFISEKIVDLYNGELNIEKNSQEYLNIVGEKSMMDWANNLELKINIDL